MEEVYDHLTGWPGSVGGEGPGERGDGRVGNLLVTSEGFYVKKQVKTCFPSKHIKKKLKIC